jgi:uncharacterized protein involved in exopolysaccharide biosynthesis
VQRIVIRNGRSDTKSLFWAQVLLPVLRYRRLTYILVATTMTVTLIYCLLAPNQYTATATILPSGKPDQLAQLSQLAAGSLADVGIGSMIQSQESSSALYPRILSSRLIGEKILGRTFLFHDRDRTANITLGDYIGAPNSDIALLELAQMVRIGLDRSTGFITLAVTTPHAELSSAIARAYLEELNNYNVNYRQSKARDNERFVTERLQQVRAELQCAEDSLRLLQQQNLNYMSAVDPTLRTELARLERDVKVKETVFLTLSEKAELARLEAVKDVPVVQVLDRGDPPQVKSAPHRSVYLVGALVGSCFISLIVSLWLDFANRRRLRTQLANVVSSPDLSFSRTETAVMGHAARLLGMKGHGDAPVDALDKASRYD